MTEPTPTAPTLGLAERARAAAAADAAAREAAEESNRRKAAAYAIRHANYQVTQVFSVPYDLSTVTVDSGRNVIGRLAGENIWIEVFHKPIGRSYSSMVEDGTTIVVLAVTDRNPDRLVPLGPAASLVQLGTSLARIGSTTGSTGGGRFRAVPEDLPLRGLWEAKYSAADLGISA
jgi:hypothetical protein